MHMTITQNPLCVYCQNSINPLGSEKAMYLFFPLGSAKEREIIQLCFKTA